MVLAPGTPLPEVAAPAALRLVASWSPERPAVTLRAHLRPLPAPAALAGPGLPAAGGLSAARSAARPQNLEPFPGRRRGPGTVVRSRAG
ncbi:protein of unknown function [Candidatus Hydrogenisulfobacillus filiaventi]|uniref:Uncharacterized protein n=1 Tax=Candidatus Hydrogenisulfobacillus filiaventi TaxID=2707344 RepID=A0A6F8ZHN0_9FIRM|nr:protein of unknown function [Candidatus Hydrogenisulfobacillus filiaventi]